VTVRIINADVLDGLRSLPDESVHCCVTSPPYWGLRDYGVEGQIGLEPTPAEFVARLVDVFREVRRVLRSDGTCWVNMGDSYAATTKGSSGKGEKQISNAGTLMVDRSWSIPAGLKPKDLCGVPWRLAFALQDDGWWLRQDIIWSKPNPMPESVTDRCTKAHEYVFLLTKSARYFYDAEAVKEAATYPDGPNSPGSIASPYGQGFERRARASGNISHKGVTEYEGSESEEHRTKAGLLKISETAYERRNKRSVWTIATNPFPEAHFATFPPELPEICIKAGCPKGGTVLDPFGGAGTSGLVADRLQRHAILIELNPDYAAMAERRINGDRGGLLDQMEAAE
jgi:DNA modification methylase